MYLITFKYKKDNGDITNPIVAVTKPFPVNNYGNMVPRIAGYCIDHIPSEVYNRSRGTMRIPLKSLQQIIKDETSTNEEILDAQCFIDSFRQYKFENMSEVKILIEGRY